MNRKAFTLVELIATIAILGILALITVPAILKLIDNNDDKTMKYFGETLINSAKAYVEDGKLKTNSVTCDELKNAGYIKECKIDRYDCTTMQVTIEKMPSNTNIYTYYLVCGKQGKAMKEYNNRK